MITTKHTREWVKITLNIARYQHGRPSNQSASHREIALDIVMVGRLDCLPHQYLVRLILSEKLFS